jgi:hypothetical protein
MHQFFLSADRRLGDHNLNKPGFYVIDETGDEPLPGQCRNRPERCDVDGNRRAQISDRLGYEAGKRLTGEPSSSPAGAEQFRIDHGVVDRF